MRVINDGQKPTENVIERANCKKNLVYTFVFSEIKLKSWEHEYMPAYML